MYRCPAALSLDRDHMKAHYYLGAALQEEGELEAAIGHLTRALDAARQQQDAIKDEIWRALAACKYALWQAQSQASTGSALLQHRILRFDRCMFAPLTVKSQCYHGFADYGTPCEYPAAQAWPAM